MDTNYLLTDTILNLMNTKYYSMDTNYIWMDENFPHKHLAITIFEHIKPGLIMRRGRKRDPYSSSTLRHYSIRNNGDLRFDLHRMLKARNIIHPVAYLQKIGFSSSTAVNYMNNRLDGVKWKHLQIFCIALNCTPNDLFTWYGEGGTVAENHELLTLKRNPVESLQDKLLTLPPHKLEEIRKLIESADEDSKTPAAK